VHVLSSFSFDVDNGDVVVVVVVIGTMRQTHMLAIRGLGFWNFEST
jgi:hypothetical protein